MSVRNFSFVDFGAAVIRRNSCSSRSSSLAFAWTTDDEDDDDIRLPEGATAGATAPDAPAVFFSELTGQPEITQIDYDETWCMPALPHPLRLVSF